MAKPTAAEVVALLNLIASKYEDLDMRFKANETYYERVEIGAKLYKVGFTFEEDNMTIRIVNRTPVN